MIFHDKKAEYIEGIIDKNQYYRDMFDIHKHLFDYPELLANSPLRKIAINDHQVIFTIESAGKEINISCDKRDAHSLPMTYLNFGEYETEESSMLLKLIRPGNVVLDIGANIGWYTINILMSHKNVSVYSFEPMIDSYKHLINNLKLNDQNTDKAFNIGLSDENKRVNFYFDRECTAASSMANLREGDDTILLECEVRTLDSFANDTLSLSRIDFIKCDVEGAELLVFKGGKEEIAKNKPIVFSEILRKWTKKFGYHPNDILDFFRSMDYECYVINKGKLELFDRVDEETLQTNYLFFHKAKHSQTIKENQ